MESPLRIPIGLLRWNFWREIGGTPPNPPAHGLRPRDPCLRCPTPICWWDGGTPLNPRRGRAYFPCFALLRLRLVRGKLGGTSQAPAHGAPTLPRNGAATPLLLLYRTGEVIETEH